MPQPGERRKPYHHGDLRRALLDAARDELRAAGWAELSLRSVARRAGVTHAAAYHHFESRQALLLALALEGFDRLDERLREAMDGAGDDPVDRLCAAGVAYVRTAADDPFAYELMTNAAFAFAVTDAERERSRRPFSRLVAAVDAARRASGVATGDTLTDAFLHWELVHGLALLARGNLLAGTFGSVEAHARAVHERLRALYRR